MRKHRSTAVAFMACIGASTVGAIDAHAAMMTHSDLASMAFEADAVVRARRTREQRVDQWTVVTDTVVEKTYQGPLAPGDHVLLDYGLYGSVPVLGAPDAGATSDVVILFLRANRDAALQRQWDAGPVQDWWIESSGLRIELGGVIHRFEQESNPGGFVPVPQGHDPYDLVNDPRGGSRGLTWATFEPELLYGLGRARAVREAMERAGTPAGRDALIELLGPADPDDPSIPVPSGWVGFYRDQIAQAIVTRIAAEKDVTRVLRALVRAHGTVQLFPLREQLPRPELVRIASSASAPKEERVAAIQLLGRYRGPDEAMERAAVTKLLEDPEPDVRIAAAHAAPPDLHPAQLYAQVLARQLRAEKDERVLFEQVESARDHQLASILTGRKLDEPLVSATRAGRALHVGWLTLKEQELRITQVVVTASGPTQRTLSFAQKDLMESRSYAAGSSNLALAFDPQLAAGRYELACDVTLESGKGAPIRRHFVLPPLLAKAATPRPVFPFAAGVSGSDAGSEPGMAAEEPRDAGGANADASSTSAPATAPATTVVATPPRQRGGCALNGEPGEDDPSRTAVVAFALFASVLLLKRGHAGRSRR